MERDFRHTEGPWIPGLAARFEWADPDDPDIATLRAEAQDGGPHLFILYTPVTLHASRVKVLAEAYYPADMQAATWEMLDPRQHADWQDGRLIVISTVPLKGTFRTNGNRPGSVNAFFRLTTDMMEELRRNNRNARRELKRKASAVYHKQELKSAIEEHERKAAENSEFADAMVSAYKDHKIQRRPHIYT